MTGLVLVSLDAHAESLYVYYDYYYNSDGEQMNMATTIYGDSENATYMSVYTAIYVWQPVSQTYRSMLASVYYYYKFNNEWYFIWGWQEPQWLIDMFISGQI